MITPKRTVTFSQLDVAMIPPGRARLTCHHPSPLLTLPNCSDTCFLLMGMTETPPLSTYSSQSLMTSGAPRLVSSYFRHVTDLGKPGSKVTQGFLLEQGKEGISR